jgi:hypothetical protein
VNETYVIFVNRFVTETKMKYLTVPFRSNETERSNGQNRDVLTALLVTHWIIPNGVYYSWKINLSKVKGLKWPLIFVQVTDRALIFAAPLSFTLRIALF